MTRVQISGASAGAGVAVALVLGVPLGDMASDTLAGQTSRRFVDSSNTDIHAGVQAARNGYLGPFSPSFNVSNWIRENLEKRLPPNAHEIVMTRYLNISKYPYCLCLSAAGGCTCL